MCLAISRHIVESEPVVSAPPSRRVGVLIACHVGLAVGLARFMHLAEQGGDVVAKLLLGRGWQPPPGAFAVDAVDEILQSALDVAFADLVDGEEHACSQRRRRAGLDRWIERGVEIAAGLGQHHFAQ